MKLSLIHFSIFHFLITIFVVLTETVYHMQLYFDSLSLKLNFIVLTETWLSAGTHSMCNFDGYTSVERVCGEFVCIREVRRGSYDSELNEQKLNELFICSITNETYVCRVYIDMGYFVILGVYCTT